MHGIMALCLFTSLIGAKLLNFILFPELRKQELFHAMMNSGFTYYGGLASFLILSGAVFKFKYGERWIVVLNEIIPAIPLFHSIARIGCFLGGCCYGSKIKNTDILYPTQLVESVFLFGLFIFLSKIKRNRFPLYLILYGIARFIIEFFRGDNRGELFGIFSPSQEISVLFIIVGSLTFFTVRSRIFKTRSNFT